MRVKYFSLNKPIIIDKPISACIGYFDGLHKGHQELVKKAKEKSLEYQCESCLITFFPDPKNVLENNEHKHIQSFKQRLKIAENLGIDLVIIFEFDLPLAKLSKEEFFDKILMILNLKCLVCGFDWRYASMGSGNYLTLIESAKGYFDVEVIESVNYLNEKISSTRIRQAIIEGNIELVNKMLGYQYFLTGKIIKGKSIGRTIGFPTANLKIDAEFLILKDAVYMGFVKYDGQYFKAMINIGYNETIACDNKRTIEVHILDFKKDIYGENITVFFNKKIRDNYKFNSIEELKEQLLKDIDVTRGQVYEQRFIL